MASWRQENLLFQKLLYFFLVAAYSVSHVQLLVTPWTVTHQASLCMEFSRQEYWSGLPFPPPGTLPEPEIELMSIASPALAGGLFTTGHLRTQLFH